MDNNNPAGAGKTALAPVGQEFVAPDHVLPAKNKGGRPPYRRDERIAKQVEAMSGYGIPRAQIAGVVGICENTLRKYYPDELELGATKANAKVIESLFRKAVGDGQGSVAAAIFWAKARCGWRETQVNEHTHQLATLRRNALSPEEWAEQYGHAPGDDRIDG